MLFLLVVLSSLLSNHSVKVFYHCNGFRHQTPLINIVRSTRSDLSGYLNNFFQLILHVLALLKRAAKVLLVQYRKT